MELFDERYEMSPVISQEKSVPIKDNLAHFSRDIKDVRYKIRVPEVQKEWGLRKTVLQRRVGKLILMTDYGINELLLLCEKLSMQSGTKNIFTVITKDEEGLIHISHDKSSVVVVRNMLRDFLSGEGDLTREQMIDTIVTHYNLSYHHFTKHHAFFIIEESHELAKLLKKWNACDYNVMKHPLMQKEAKSYMTVLKSGRKFAIKIATQELERVYKELNVEIETTMLRKVSLNSLLEQSAFDGDFILRALKVLNNALIQYRNKLTETNMRLVMKIAHAHSKKAVASGLYVPDLISQGAEGMIKAAEMFVSDVEVKFTTYAERWVKLNIQRHIKNTNPVRIPIHCTDLVFKICGLFKEKGLIDGMDLPSRKDTEIELGCQISVHVWEMTENHFQNITTSVSCDYSGAFEEGTISLDTLLGDNTDEHNELLLRSVRSDQILEIAKSKLSKNEFEVLHRHFMHEESYSVILSHLDRHYSSKSISMIKTRAITKIQSAIKEMMPDEFKGGTSNA